jgi:methylenetetrahydrofolate dehydrogenase (NADP+)/methenyltetrahydrofolate cyclohydrolase
MKIDGKQIANEIFENLKPRIDKLKEQGIIPHLAIILIDKDPASVAYVNQKEIKGKKIGAKISVKNLLSDTSEKKLLSTIEQFNNNNNVHGIIVQRPLPKNIDSNAISLTVNPNKDVDGFHPNSKFRPPIALAVLKILKTIYPTPSRWPNGLLEGGFQTWLSSQKIVIIGKGETGGRPIIQMLKDLNIKPLIIDTKTPNPPKITRSADIIISAVGKPDTLRPEMLKKNVILIGIGLHRGNDGKLHGDYDEEKIKNIASFYTPTPGGVGPINVAMLLENLVTAAENLR